MQNKLLCQLQFDKAFSVSDKYRKTENKRIAKEYKSSFCKIDVDFCKTMIFQKSFLQGRINKLTAFFH